ncbi:glycosyltransferase [Telmatospirillum sp. J64-1]|uniref:glycosyltransferase n=1 Tax=Telmatospirillum sp. J64-1 TaxID=2502183 RepID=UPI00163DCE51|nr:glycosyltransferase [Telmatospirillum sp. J64-1]
MLQDDLTIKPASLLSATGEDSVAGAKIQGSFDGVHDGRAYGWLWYPDAPSLALRLQVVVQGKAIAEGVADVYREDLFVAGIGDGRHAFVIPVPSHVKASEIEIRALTDGYYLLEDNQNEERHPLCPPTAQPTAFSITYYPDYTATNPYQFLLGASLPDEFSVTPGTIDEALEAAQKNPRGFGGQPVFHMHWTTPIIAPAANKWDAIRRKEHFLAKLRSFISMGGLVIWTVHNTLSHDRKFPDIERDLCAQLARIASFIHVHSQAVVDAVRDEYNLPADKIWVIPHPSYIGVYVNETTKEKARIRLGIPTNHFVYAFIGQLRPYKGIEDLLNAFGAVAAHNPDSHLLIAGRPVAPYEGDTVSRMASAYVNTTVVERHVPDDELQWFFNAADVVVLPYRDVLTSGSVLNALSFARPVVAPCLGMIPEVVEDGSNGFLYEPSTPDALVEAMTRAIQVRDVIGEFAERALESVRTNTWANFGKKLADGIREASATHQVELDVGGITRTVTASRRPGPNGPQARVAIIILAYGHLDDVERLITSIEASSFHDVEIFLIDNGSPGDPAFHELMTYKPNSKIRFTCIKTHENLGYAGGNNVGIAFCLSQNFDYIWILNPDVEVTPRALAHLVDAAEKHFDASVFGAAIFYGSDKRRIWSAGGKLSFNLGLDAGHRYNGEQKSALPTEPYPADYLTGASLFCRTSVFRAGNFIPEEYFLYFEETHWCLQLHRSGIGLLVVPAAELYHHKRSESDGLPAPYYFYYYIRNALLFTEYFCPKAVRTTSMRIRKSFIDPWLSKIQQNAPDNYIFFKNLADLAIQDAKNRTYGMQQLNAAFVKSGSHAGHPRFEGSLDGVTNGLVFGWLVDREAPGQAVEVTVEVDGSAVATKLAADFRADLQAAGYGCGNHGFSLTLPNNFCDGRAHHVMVRACDGTEIGFCKVAVSPRATAIGRIEGVAGYHLNGWAYNPTFVREKVALEVLDETGLVITEGVADQYRADLAATGIGHGYHGFSFRLPLHLLDGKEHEFVIRAAADCSELSRRRIQTKMPVPLVPDGSLRDQLRWMFYNRETRYSEKSSLVKHFDNVSAVLSARYRKNPEADLVSVIMPTFNRAETIGRAVNSVLAQTYSNFELIIVDDGSTDDTVSTIANMTSTASGNRVQLIELTQNRGVSAARNAGLAASRGEVVAYLDSDNEWHEDFLLIMVNALKEAGASSAYCGQSVWHVVGNDEEPVMVRAGDFWLSLLENRNYIDLNCFVHTRQAYNDCGGFNEEMRRLVDWELIARYARYEAPAYVPALLSRYFMGRAENQITRVETYADNLKKMNATLSKYQRNNRKENNFSPLIGIVMAFDVEDLHNLSAAVRSMALSRYVSELHILVNTATHLDGVEHWSSTGCKLTVHKIKEAASGWSRIEELLPQATEDDRIVVLMKARALASDEALRQMAEVLADNATIDAVIPQRVGNAVSSQLDVLTPFASSTLPIDMTIRKAESFAINPKKHVFAAEVIDPFFVMLRPEALRGIGAAANSIKDFEEGFSIISAVLEMAAKDVAKCERARVSDLSSPVG